MSGIDSDETDKGFGNFLASFVSDPKAAIALTAILLLIFAMCFIMNCITLKITSNIEAFILAPPEPSNFRIQKDSVRS